MAYVGVSGPGSASAEECALAREVGHGLAGRGHVVVCGGLGGVMEAAARGAAEGGGLSVGLLPGDDRAADNAYLTVALPTGLGEMRNALLVRSVDVLVCVGGSWGTLSELALAMRTGVPVVALRTWLPAGTPAAPWPVEVASSSEALEAVGRLLA